MAYDPYEEHRRRIMMRRDNPDPGMIYSPSDPDANPDPGMTFLPRGSNPDPGIMWSPTLEMEPDEEPDNDEDDYTSESSVKPAQAGPSHNIPGVSRELSPAETNYRRTLQSAPLPEDYKAGKLRRILAAVSGGVTTFNEGSEKGAAAANDVLYKPYQRAAMNYQVALDKAAKEFQMEKAIRGEDVAARRASAYERSAAAREAAAQATEAWRRYQEKHMPWAPQTKEDVIELEKIRHPGAAQRPSEFQQYLEDPEGYEAYQKARAAGKTGPMTTEEFARREEIKNRMRARYRAPKGQKDYAPAPPQVQFQAEQYAREQVLREHPEFEQFMTSERRGTKTVRRTKRADELPKASSGFLGFGGTTSVKAGLARDQYNQFLQEVEKRKKAVLGRRGGAQPTWEIQRED